MPPRKTLTDEGDPLPANPSQDAAAAIHLLEWARAKGFRVGPIFEVGTIKMQIRDIRQERNEKSGRGQEYDTMPDPYEGTDEPEPGTMG